MAKRKAIYLQGFGHRNPIPAACRIGNTVVSGIIYGLDTATGRPAPTLDEQAKLMFQHLRSVIEAAGGLTDDIIKLTLWMVDRSKREAINREWLAMFPDPETRPARQAMQAELGGGILVQCDFLAVIGER